MPLIDLNVATPKDIRETLTDIGGKNPYGHANWRLILAQNHLVTRSGEWLEFAPGEESFLFQADMSVQHKPVNPRSSKKGTMEVPLYPVRGWILERWMPSEVFGTKEAWDAVKAADGVTPMMGPYPVEGDWWMLQGPWDLIPPMSSLRTFISAWENSTEHTHGRIDPEMLKESYDKCMAAIQQQEVAEEVRVYQQAAYARKHYIDAAMNNPKLAAWRNEQFRKHGVKDNT